jgi:hypothetical protein
MSNVVLKIDSVSGVSKSSIQIMTVHDILNGEAISLFDENEVRLEENFIHAASVPFLAIGDKVIIQKISGNIIVTDKIRNLGEKPTVGFEINDDGSLNLFSDISIVLKTLNAKIDLSANGKIMIDGHEVYSISNGINRIQGTSIELN